MSVGNKVTLKSLLPDTTVTVRVSGFHPELGTDTTTMCSPIETLSDIGVTFPVSTPSIATFAPDGYDVTFSEPLPCARTLALNPSVTQTNIRTPTTLGIFIALSAPFLVHVGKHQER